MDLGVTVGKFLIFCNVPQQWHHELGLCVVLYARVEHKELWASNCQFFLPLLVNLDSAVLWDEAAWTNLTRTLT